MKSTFHVGKMLLEYMSLKELKKSDIADLAGIPRTSVYVYQKMASFQTSNLFRFCHVLKYNFFQDMADTLPKDYAHGKLAFSEKDALIDKLTEQNRKLQNEVDVLKEVMMGKKSN